MARCDNSLPFTFYIPRVCQSFLSAFFSDPAFYEVTSLYFYISFRSCNSLLIYTDLHCLFFPPLTFILALQLDKFVLSFHVLCYFLLWIITVLSFSLSFSCAVLSLICSLSPSQYLLFLTSLSHTIPSSLFRIYSLSKL